ncbi:hypothetical protein [Halopseudomonas oceani]|uniref:hypothetical protein n=1 Tax=Halopseudomonas oceani TaxID=1708783 RepID=UPI002AA948E1|nr:hypothetical protein [Halopseudomonas oceani]
MNKVLLVSGCLLLCYALAAYAAGWLPVGLGQGEGGVEYMKVVPSSDGSVDWAQYRLPALLAGLGLIVVGWLRARAR